MMIDKKVAVEGFEAHRRVIENQRHTEWKESDDRK
jgi:hypothetical protein